MLTRYAILIAVALLVLAGLFSVLYIGPRLEGILATQNSLSCKVNITNYPTWQNQTAFISDLQRIGISEGSRAYNVIAQVNVTALDIDATHQLQYVSDVSGYAWVRQGWLPYLSIERYGTHWGIYIAQNNTQPIGIAFYYGVYDPQGTSRNYYGSFFGAYDLRYGSWEFSPFNPMPTCLHPP